MSMVMAGVEGQMLRLGGGYLSDIAETELDFGDDYFKTGSNYLAPVSAVAMYLAYRGRMADGYELGLIGEYIESRRFSERVYVDALGGKERIAATNAELALFGERFWVGGKYQKFSGFDWLFAQKRDPSLQAVWFESYGGFGGFKLNEFTSLGWQVMHGRDSAGDGLWETMGKLKLRSCLCEVFGIQ